MRLLSKLVLIFAKEIAFVKKTRLISALLAVILLGTACASVAVDDETTEESVTEAVTEAPEEELTDGLPEDLNYGDEVINILNTEYIVSGPKDFDPDVSVHEQQASVVQEANYYRRIAVEDRLGVQINFIDHQPFGEIKGMVRQSVNAGSNDYDMVFNYATYMVDLVYEGMFLPVSELTYVDLDKPWWNKEYIEAVSININNPYILFGDITYNSVQRTTCVFFNKALLTARLGMTDDDMYQLVLDGKWTIDKFTELASAVYEDNGNTRSDYNDIHGLVIYNTDAFNWMAFSSGLEFTARDEEGYPVLNLNTEAASDLCDKLLKLFSGDHLFVASTNDDHVNKFATNKALFIVNRLFLADWVEIRAMEDDYGIIPMPKYDESIDGYHATVADLTLWGCVPITTPDPVMISAVAESMAFEGYKNVMPAYYETALKLKYTRGEDSDTETQIIDMIAGGARTDFLYMNRLDGLGRIFANVYERRNNMFASIYASYEQGANMKLKTLIQMDRDSVKQ